MSETDTMIALAVRDARASGGSTWVRVNCPLCALTEDKPDRKRSFGFNTATRGYSCFRCGAKGKLRDLDGLDLPEPPEEQPEAKPITLPEGFFFLDGDRSEVLEPAREYLRGRGVTAKQIATARIGACISGFYSGRVVVPMYDAAGDLRWFVGRAWTKHAERPYLYPRGDRGAFMYNEAAVFEDTDVPVLIVEGAFDAIACWPHGVAALGKTQPAQVDLLSEARRPVVFVPDGDDWYAGGWALSRLLRARGVESGYVKLPPKVDPDEIEFNELMDLAYESLGA